MERVLIVVDVLSARQSLAEVLEEKGFSTETAAGGRGALGRLRMSGSFSVVISDIQMPGMDGLDLVRRISEIDPTTILLTGLASESRILSALRAGAFDFLSKPYTHAELDQVLTRALERRKVILGNERYRHSLEQAVEERNSEITGTNQTLIELCDLGQGSHEKLPIQAGVDGFADYALRHFNADTFGIFVLEDAAFSALVVRDRFGRNIDRALLETNSPSGSDFSRAPRNSGSRLGSGTCRGRTDGLVTGHSNMTLSSAASTSATTANRLLRSDTVTSSNCFGTAWTAT